MFFGEGGNGGNLLFLSCNFINLGTWQAESMSNFSLYQVHYQCFLIEHLVDRDSLVPLCLGNKYLSTVISADDYL